MRKRFPFGRFIGVIVFLSARVAAAPQPLQIDEGRSQIEVRVTATAHAFTARLDQFISVIMVDSEGGVVTGATLTFHLTDVSTGIRARDRAMQQWEEIERFPDGHFLLGSLAPAGGGHFIAHGRMTLHGISREVVFPVSITTDRKIYAVDGTVALNTQDFGLPKIRKLGVLRVDSTVTVKFHLQGTLSVERSIQGSLPQPATGNKVA